MRNIIPVPELFNESIHPSHLARALGPNTSGESTWLDDGGDFVISREGVHFDSIGIFYDVEDFEGVVGIGS